MQLPFSEAQFLDTLGAFNTALWPVISALWIATLIVSWQLMAGRPRSTALGVVMVLQFLLGAVYHAFFFSRVNPAAWLFAALFTIQAVALLSYAIKGGRLTFEWRRSWRHAAAAVLVVYALAYPALALLTGHQVPRVPLFGVPCPTVLFTAGVLLTAVPAAPRWLFLIPVAWSIVGGSAALLLGMPADGMLWLAAVLLSAAGLVIPGRSHRVRPSVAERDRSRSVDQFVPRPNYRQVLAMDMNARPEDIWPWLMQLGYQRGGLYSYDWLDRLFGYLDRPSSDRLLPGYPDLQVGDVIPIGRGKGFPVAAVEPRRSLVLAGEQDGFAWGWELALDPQDDRRTRLVSRTLAQTPRTWRSRVFLIVLRLAAWVMTRRMLAGLKWRAEAVAAVTQMRLSRAA